MFVKMYLDLINSISDDFFAAVDKAMLDSMKLILGLIIVIAAPLLVLGKSPHVIFIFADDLGFNDIGYTNPGVISPNLDQLAANGVILDRNYVQPVCTPTRAAFMTGKYPYKIGRQGFLPLTPWQPTGLTLDFKVLPEVMKDLGYSTHMIGKWHLGTCKPEYLPPQRGFDSFFGFWSGNEDYYEKTTPIGNWNDFFLNNDVYESNNVYSTNLYSDRAMEVIQQHNDSNPLFLYAAMQSVHTPLQVPQEYEDLYSDVDDPDRKTYLGMVTAMDHFVGDLVASLKAKGMYEDSVIIFSSDNGGMENNGAGASNYPLHGQKAELYEGGVRVPGFVHSPKYIQNPGRTYDNLVHVSDWFPTILKLANYEHPEPIDGIDQFNAIFRNNASDAPRKMVVNDLSNGVIYGYHGAFQIEDGWKFVNNPTVTGVLDRYYLFNVFQDPTETTDLKDTYPDIFEQMKSQYKELLTEMVDADFPPPNPIIDITDGNGNLATGWC